MREFATKVDNVGDTLTAGGFNAYIEELENICTSADFTLDSETGPDTNLNMLGQSACAYGSASGVLADSGAANAYVLGRLANSNLKTTSNKYYDGQLFVFEAGNTNSGASTVNAFGVGVKDLVLRGSALSGSEIIAGEKIIIIWDEANDRFDLLPTSEAVETTGFVKMWPLASAPSGYLECDGSAISRTTYADLFAVLGTTYGVGDGSTTFNLPNYLGEFLRGWNHGAGADPDAASRTDRGDGTTGDNIGTKQADASQGHRHKLWAQIVNPNGGSAGLLSTSSAGTTLYTYRGVDDPMTDGVNGTPRITSENRSTNVNIMCVVKF